LVNIRERSDVLNGEGFDLRYDMIILDESESLLAHFAEQTEWGQRLVNSLFTLATMIGMSVQDTTLGTTIAKQLGDESFPADPEDIEAFLTDAEKNQEYVAEAFKLMQAKLDGDLSAAVIALAPGGSIELARKYQETGDENDLRAARVPDRNLKLTRVTRGRPGLTGQLRRQFLEARLPLVAQVRCSARKIDFGATDLPVQIRDGLEETIRLLHVGTDLLGEVGLDLLEPLVRDLHPIHQRRGLLNERLPLSEIGGPGRKSLKSVEERRDRLGEAVTGTRSTQGHRIARATDLLPEARLGALVGCRLRIQRGGRRDLAYRLAIQQYIAQLLDLQRLQSERLGSLGREDRATISQHHALPRVVRIVHVGEVATRRLHRTRLGGESADARG
jgi:hypothetical protein